MHSISPIRLTIQILTPIWQTPTSDRSAAQTGIRDSSNSAFTSPSSYTSSACCLLLWVARAQDCANRRARQERKVHKKRIAREQEELRSHGSNYVAVVSPQWADGSRVFRTRNWRKPDPGYAEQRSELLVYLGRSELHVRASSA